MKILLLGDFYRPLRPPPDACISTGLGGMDDLDDVLFKYPVDFFFWVVRNFVKADRFYRLSKM